MGHPSILHLNTAIAWRGGEVQTFLLARGLQERGYTNIIVAQPASELLKRAVLQGLPAVALPMRGEWDLRAVQELRRSIRRMAPDIIHAHTAHACTLGLLARSRKGPRIVYSRRVSFPQKKNPLSKWKSRAPDAILAVSKHIQEELIRSGLPVEKVFLAESATDFVRIDQAQPRAKTREEWKIPEDAFLIGNVSHFDPAKRQDLLIHVFLDLATKPVRIKPYLILIGDGPQLEECKSLAVNSHLSDQIVFTGHRSDPENFYRAMDLFAFPSKMMEGMPGVLREAMGSGLPVVAYRQPAIAELIIDGETGILVSEDVGEWAIAMEELLQDSNLRMKLGNAASEYARQFTVDALLDKTEVCYRKILEATATSDQG